MGQDARDHKFVCVSRFSDDETKIYPRNVLVAKSGDRTIISALKIFFWKSNLFWTRTLKKRSFKRRYRHPLYRANPKLITLVERELHGFIPWTTIHYNTQLLTAGYNARHQFWANNLYNNELDLAANYVQRNRSRLLEWWCLRDGRIRWLNTNDLIKIDLGIPFDVVLAEKLK